MPDVVGPRRVDVVELWCGVGSIVASTSATGYVVRKFDRHRVPGVTEQRRRLDVIVWFDVRCPLCADNAHKWPAEDGACVFLLCLHEHL